jgi:hypothetical protein
MAFIKKRTNKKFDYKPRFYKNEGEGSPFAMKHKFEEFRSTVDTPKGIKGKISAAFNDLKSSADSSVKKRLLIIIIILVLLFLYIIDFDLSIFMNK